MRRLQDSKRHSCIKAKGVLATPQSGKARPSPSSTWRTATNRASERPLRGFWANRLTGLGWADRLCNSSTRAALIYLHAETHATEPSPTVSTIVGTTRLGAAAEQHATLQVLSEPPPAGNDVVLISNALDIPHTHPAVLHDLGSGETAVFRPGAAGKAPLLARIGESAWPALLQTMTTAPTPSLDNRRPTQRSGRSAPRSI